MKRSEINARMRDAIHFFRDHHFQLPPFAFWTPEEWTRKGPEVREIIEAGLGWDITDFGHGDFEKEGLLLFTLRNGLPRNLETRQGKMYAEKIMIVGVDQVTPLHFHWIKMEDIINRAGGKLVIQLYRVSEEEGLAETPVEVQVDGVTRRLEAGAPLTLHPGESVSFPPRFYHKFWGAEHRVLVGEVSLVNDDDKDNRFYEPVGRFPEIDEDEEPLHLLVKDYSRFYNQG